MATNPTGIIQTKIPNVSSPVRWEDITRYDEFVTKEAEPLGWPIERIRAHIAIESQGFKDAIQMNTSNGYSYGLMQVVPYGYGWEGWHKLVKEKAGLPANADRDTVIAKLFDPAINIACGVAILESFYQQYGTTDKASSAFFTGRSDWGAGDTVNGTTGEQYRDAMNGLIAEQKAFGDVIDRLFGGNPYTISADYGQPVTWQCPIGVNPGQRGNCYEYQKAYGLDDMHHYAYDVSAHAGDGAPLYAPFDGLVVCAGTGVGGGAWGTGCGFNARLNNYGGLPARAGSGRLELLNEDGTASLIIGHVLGSRVNPGDRVQAGDHIGWQGGMNASHVHLEGRYANGTRIGDPRTMFPPVTGAPADIPKAERLPIPQPEEFDTTVTVTVIADTLPVLQRADLDASPVSDPLVKGDTFEAVYQAVGNDGRIYWISKFAGRVPVEGTSAPDWKGGTVSIGGGITQESLDVLVDTLDHIVISHESDISDMQGTSKALRGVITALGNLKGV